MVSSLVFMSEYLKHITDNLQNMTLVFYKYIDTSREKIKEQTKIKSKTIFPSLDVAEAFASSCQDLLVSQLLCKVGRTV